MHSQLTYSFIIYVFNGWDVSCYLVNNEPIVKKTKQKVNQRMRRS